MSKPENGASNGGGTDQAAWDEGRLDDSIQRLNVLQAKARALRETIPKMLDPLVQKQASPEVLYSAFMKAVNDAQADITDFTDMMREEESKAVFAQAQKSHQEDSTDIKPWRHKDHPGWYDYNGKS